jgi:hypothetical protein
MRFRDIFIRRKSRLSASPLISDWTTGWTGRDGVELPHQPRRARDFGR